MSERRFALIVANSEYEDTELRRLTAPDNDAASLARVLGDPALGGFQVQMLVNETSGTVSQAIEEFFTVEERTPDDLLLLYFSGHGIKDDDGQLYFAVKNTRMVRHKPLRATAVGAAFVSEVVRSTRSRRQVLLLDCCYSGAFASSLMTKGDNRVGVEDHFQQGRGLVLLTASNSLQYSLEEQVVESGGIGSVFTRHLVRGIETGEAARGEENVSIDDLYDYVLDRVTHENPQQHPRKWNLNLEGKIYIARNPAPLKAASLPPELQESIDDLRNWVRRGAVEELGRLLADKRRGVALAARESLLVLRDSDDSSQVRSAAAQCLAAFEQTNPSPPAGRNSAAVPMAAAAGAGEPGPVPQLPTGRATPPTEPQALKRRAAGKRARAAQRPKATQPAPVKPTAPEKLGAPPAAEKELAKAPYDRRQMELIQAAFENWKRAQAQSPQAPAPPVRKAPTAEELAANERNDRRLRELMAAAIENWKRTQSTSRSAIAEPTRLALPPAPNAPVEHKPASSAIKPEPNAPAPTALDLPKRAIPAPKQKPKPDPEPLLSAVEIAMLKTKRRP